MLGLMRPGSLSSIAQENEAEKNGWAMTILGESEATIAILFYREVAW